MVRGRRVICFSGVFTHPPSGYRCQISFKETGYERSVTTNDSSSYRITNLKPGTYDVAISASGFKKAVADSVAVSFGTTTPLDVRLTADGSSETIEVHCGEARGDRTDNQVARRASLEQVVRERSSSR